MIAFRGITRVYGQGDARVSALAGIDLDVASGEFVAFMGPSGSGKSTALNVMGCLDRPTAGSYTFRSLEVTDLVDQERARLRRAWIGFVFQGFHLLPRSTAVENVELPLVYRGISAARRRELAEHMLDEVGLADRRHHLPSALSGGQQQRVAIARALVTEPQLLLADEPTGNLDTARSEEIIALLARVNREHGQTIVMVTHEPDMAEHAHRIVHFRDGRIESEQRTGRTP
ncbi:MAG: ABC transporter ATP-binding protein [Alphaproteobacteria bacterium]|nr:ABC transporter ATP-binding protein [Alphaproteobacteria bacterium]MCB9695372.1 ABC transporter ATP-binding protein [Alphaproteobacteria bacterium]